MPSSTTSIVNATSRILTGYGPGTSARRRLAEPDLEFRAFCTRRRLPASSTPQLERAWDAWQAERYRDGPATEPERTLSRFGGQTGGVGGLSALAGWTQLRSVLPVRPDRPVISASSMSPCRASAALPSSAAALVSLAAAACPAG